MHSASFLQPSQLTRTSQTGACKTNFRLNGCIVAPTAIFAAGTHISGDRVFRAGERQLFTIFYMAEGTKKRYIAMHSPGPNRLPKLTEGGIKR